MAKLSFRRFNVVIKSVTFLLWWKFCLPWWIFEKCRFSALQIFGSASRTRAHRKFGFCCYTGTKWLLWVFFIEGTGTFIPLLALDFLPVVMQLDWQVCFNVCRHCHFMPRSIRWSCCVDLCILSELLAVVSQPVVCWSSSAEVCLLLLGSHSSAFHECMLFIAIASLNTYSVIILLKFITFVYQMLGLHIYTDA